MLLRVDPAQHLDLNTKLSDVGKQIIHQVWPVTANVPYHPYILDIPMQVGMAVADSLPQTDFEHLVSHWPEINVFAEEAVNQPTTK